ncbi:helix-turn-helix transcriptional regulator [Streptomyces sp. NBC_01724]|uniref:helix-turn-helix transcriptional regulator n=1 Tax=unclassified Streptomyces TaxID=2593676 RepID=UPI0028C42885|nr:MULTISPECIES: helix-turn-helix transcriptional regulator [unclassified Streptomyces]WNO69243.1 helix-turn-helix transcriptional regulator [Streptomyces sp. AM2-3-1]WTE56407.1 helix-turn-helix transcriptional regulator [Streptomyces sp. NBC_01620]WTE64478.1 helix-turn-helix transcriptional regulator [Streptomyces sp. NBC_01617]WTI91762.1 helix-turn-helix transcriptional regulator [Streptomyces sp. NBC_00724]
MSDSTPLGEFLRARREALKPQDVGLPGHGRRRVPGLRREEVAMLAGVSSDYYMRLEQGRESSPSPQVIDAVADALHLDDEAVDHLRRLTRAPKERRTLPAGHDQVDPQLLQLLDSWPDTPAFVVGPALDVLAHNALAAALHSGFQRFDNLGRMVFVDPAGRDFYQDWERAAQSCVAEIRAAYGHDPKSPRIAEVVETLSAKSPEFAELWARHDVKGKTRQTKNLKHAQVGDLQIQFSAFTVNEAPHQQLVVYQAEPASSTAAAFAELRSGIDNRQGEQEQREQRSGSPNRLTTRDEQAAHRYVASSKDD